LLPNILDGGGIKDYYAGVELLVVMQREKGKTTRTHEQKVLPATKIKNLKEELLAEAQKGFNIVGMNYEIIIMERANPEFPAR
jgi:hypothetical protein